MDDIGNILYIIAMLAALVYSAYKKQKKAKKPMQSPDVGEMQEREPMAEDDVLEELRELFQKPKPAVIVKEPKAKKKEVPLYMQKKQEPKKMEYSKQKAVELDTLEEGDTEFDTEQIDLRQAVIYSEILKRPYE